MEKLERKKHDHKLTKWLKFIIFALVMLAPFFSVASRCLYVVCNKNAKDSYSDKSIYQQFAITNESQFPLDQLINIKYHTEVHTNSAAIGFSYISYNAEDLGISQANYDTITTVQFILDQRVAFRNANNQVVAIKLWTNEFNMNLIATTKPNTTAIYQFAYISQTILVQNELDNVFQYSLDQIKQSDYYNWTENTGIYTAIHEMVSGLGANDVIAILLTYWSLCTAIYVVFDIVIELFIKITHLINE